MCSAFRLWLKLYSDQHRSDAAFNLYEAKKRGDELEKALERKKRSGRAPPYARGRLGRKFKRRDSKRPALKNLSPIARIRGDSSSPPQCGASVAVRRIHRRVDAQRFDGCVGDSVVGRPRTPLA